MLKEITRIKAIEEAKKTKTIKEQITTLIISSLLFAIATILITMNTAVTANLFIVALITTLVYFVMAPIGAFIYNLLINVVANKGKYKDSLVAVVQTSLIISTGLLITSLLVIIPQIGYLLGLVVMFFTTIIGLAVFIRAMTTLTGANTTQVLTILIIMVVGILIATQIVISIQLLTNPLPTDFFNGAGTERYVLDFNSTIQ